jgi:hypothetical protein
LEFFDETFFKIVGFFSELLFDIIEPFDVFAVTVDEFDCLFETLDLLITPFDEFVRLLFFNIFDVVGC